MSPAAAGGEAGEPPFSPRMLDEIRQVGGDELVREMMALFGERTPERLRAAVQAQAAGDLEGAARALHSLRSAAGTVGATRLMELAGELEREARAGGAALAAGLARLERRAGEALAAAARYGATKL